MGECKWVFLLEIIHGTNIPWAAEGESWVIHPRYKAPRMPFEQKLYDMAVVKIVDDLGLRTGYIGYSELDSVDGNVTVTGYPGSPGRLSMTLIQVLETVVVVFGSMLMVWGIIALRFMPTV
eukprot:gene11324-11411_t